MTEGKPGPVTEQTAESYGATFDTNVLGTLLSMKHEMRVMQTQGSGCMSIFRRRSGSAARLTRRFTPPASMQSRA